YALYFLLRGIGNRRYWHKLGERFGLGYTRLEGSIWIHAVSVGEVVASTPLIRALQRDYPQHPLLVTTVTPTGAARVAATFGEAVDHAYIPFENPDAVSRFFARKRPRIAMVMETEIWPNLYHGCGIRQIPLVLISARISPKSVKNYRRLLPLFRETLSHGIIIAAQTNSDADRFLSLGASPERTRVTGNIKFDIDLPETINADGLALREALFPERRVWIAASTHEGEEQKVLDAHRAILKELPDALLILVPRHPERFASVAELVGKQGFGQMARSRQLPVGAGCQVFLGDTMGEVPLFYAASDLAFVGGSLVPIGGHNLLEPAAVGVPMLSGPHVFNAEEIARMFFDLGACRRVESSAELAAAVVALFGESAARARMSARATDLLRNNRGALDRLLGMIRPLLN
ncbi:MAG: lipid IV(A) 3-deoxy-D-manno-octulosonic acid transferase, partial [Pseudomonadota bacterium]